MDTETPRSPGWLLASPTISLIATALAAAQGEMENAAKDRANPHFGGKYADLASVVQAVRAPLSRHGIAFLQPTSFDTGRVIVRTILVHKSGEWMASELSAKAQQDTPQGIGSTITYLRRYSLMAMTGIAPDDDDGEAGEGRQGAPAKASARRQAPAARPVEREDAPPEPPAPSASGHHASWERDKGAFFIALRDLLGMKYEDVAAWCEAVGRPRPSAVDNAGRRGLVDDLRAPQGHASFSGFMGPTASAAGK